MLESNSYVDEQDTASFEFVAQSKGLQHCRDIKRDAMNFYYLTGGNTKDLKMCIKMALEDYVQMLQKETTILEKSRSEERQHQ